MSIRTATLRTGTEVPEPLARAVTLVLERLMESDPIALYEAVMMARDSSHIPFGNTGDVLRGYDFTDGRGKLHQSVRDVILAAAEGDGGDLHLVSPLADMAPGVTA